MTTTTNLPQSSETSTSTSFAERTEGTDSTAKLVEDVVHGVKAAVDGALAWAEKKVDELSAEKESTGPYTSPATCMPSDFDPIAGGMLPAMQPEASPTIKVEQGQKNDQENDENEKNGKNDGAAQP
jgi:hypothetical protein